LCIHRTATHNVVDKIENYGIDQVVAVAGAAAGIAALAHANGKTTTLVTTGAAGLVALASGTQKAVPTTTASAESSIVQSGLQYLQLTDSGMPDANGDAEKTENLDKTEIAFLFDASFSTCPLNT
jgi:hypothetical protein